MKYNLGLDIGTTSVGWAVVDAESHNVIRKGNKALWGVRLFDEADAADKRRQFRSIRRRYDRRRERIRLLQEEFKDEINKIDSNFYTKLKQSFYKEEDVKNKTISLTQNEREMIKKYHKKYPTIYHLRKELIENNQKQDIRLVYLALHHMIKYRGNFLYDKKNFKMSSNEIKEKLEDIFHLMIDVKSISIEEDNIAKIDYDLFEKALFEPSKNDKKLKLAIEFEKIFSKKIAKEYVRLFVGDLFSLDTLFEKETENKLKISFKGSDFEDNYVDIEKEFGDELELLEALKGIYDQVFLSQLFKGNSEQYLSYLMVKKYEMHQKDLKELKVLLKDNKKIYCQMFKTKNKGTKKEKLCAYDEYVHNKKTYEEFTKLVKNDLVLFNNDKKVEILNKIEKEEYMPRITDVDNSKFPYQFNKEEIIKIIENQGKYYPFLLKKVNNTYKIVRLLEFCIPYYVGPLNTTTNRKDLKNKNAWLVRKKEHIKITPYNFEEVVDLESSAEVFIERMIGNCTYLNHEKAMPSHSILYSKFKVLNELKQIKVGEKGKEESLSLEMQKNIFNEFFLKTPGNVTDKKFKSYLKSNGNFDMFDDLSVIGYSGDDKFANNMQSYIDFFGEDGIFVNTKYTEQDADDIIRLMTIFEDKKVLLEKVKKEYTDLDEKALKQIELKKYKGWSNLSKKLLTEITYLDKETNTSKSILNLMEETRENFMQILFNDEYNFQDKIDELNEIDSTKKINYALVESLATSPANKKGIYQALKIIEEIIDYMEFEPKCITLEMARGDSKKQRSEDRKKTLNKIYETHQKEIDNYNKLYKELNSEEKIDKEKLFLYFIQEGKSLYSGTPLDIHHLEQYEVDHIVPRSLIKDDSIDNKALVLKEENQRKADCVVLPEEYRTIYTKTWWQRLKKIGLISVKKYNNLCRYKYDEKTISGFINRQLVETRQICKHVANIVKNYHPDSRVVYIPAILSHHYREKFELYKFRQINDYHHAHDAYLAAVLGEYREYHLKSSIDFSELKKLNQNLYQSKRYKDLSYGYVINSLDNDLNQFFRFYDENGVVHFDVKEFNKIVMNNLYRNDILISRKVEKQTGQFFDQTIYGAKDGKRGISIKENLEGYGNYTSIQVSYCTLVEYEGKKKIIGIPIFIDVKNDEQLKINYIKKQLECDNFKIIKDHIYLNTEIMYKNQLTFLRGYAVFGGGCELRNAVELHIPKEKMMLWKYALDIV